MTQQTYAGSPGVDHWAYSMETPFVSAHEWLEESPGARTSSPAQWRGTPEQVAFREEVLREAIARRTRLRPAQRDLRVTELRTVQGTRLAMRADAAEAAGRLLAAANKDLADTQHAGDADAARTVTITAVSGYRSSADQARVWRHHFRDYYQRTAAPRAGLPGGPHGRAAVLYMLDTFRVGAKVAAPGWSNHQNGIAVDLKQVRKPGHAVLNRTTDAAKRVWLATWFHRWLLRRAESFGFRPYEKEPWHWEFRGAPSSMQPGPLTAQEVDRIVEARTEGESPEAWEAGDEKSETEQYEGAAAGETPEFEQLDTSEQPEGTELASEAGLLGSEWELLAPGAVAEPEMESLWASEADLANESGHPSELDDEWEQRWETESEWGSESPAWESAPPPPAMEELEDEDRIYAETQGEEFFGGVIRNAMQAAGWKQPGSVVVKAPPPAIAVGAITEPDRPLAGADGANFAGLTAVATFARAAARCYAVRMAERRAREQHAKAVTEAERAARATRVPGETSAQRAARIAKARSGVRPRPVEEVRQEIEKKFHDWLAEEFALTVRGAANRWPKRNLNSVARDWMHGRREHVDFVTLGTPGTWLRNFDPAPRPATGDTLEPLGDLGEGPPVQPAMARFLRELKRRHGQHRASNYQGHGGGSFNQRGLSIDLYLTGTATDDRGFWPREKAVEFLLAVDAAAKATGVRWRALYNDYSVALAVNSATGVRNVAFVGQARKGPRPNLNWHGPLILHFHVDVTP